MRVLMVALLAVGFLVFSSAEAKVVTAHRFGCGKWIEARESKGAAAHVVENWADGYLSGLAIGTGIEFWRKGGNRLDKESAYLWIDNYCRANPLKTTAEASSALFREHTAE